MKRGIQVILVLAVFMLYSCAPAPTPTLAPTRRPTAVPLPTPAPPPVSTPAACPSGYRLHNNAQSGFSACYPTGWTPWAREDPDQGIRWVQFIAPESAGASTTQAQLKFVSVSTSPLPLGPSEDEFLRQMDKALRIEYQDQLKVGPHVIVLDGRRAVDASYDAPVVLGREVLSMAAWMTIFVARGQQWAIEVVGPSEYREELGQIRDQFLAQFHVLAATQ